MFISTSEGVIGNKTFSVSTKVPSCQLPQAAGFAGCEFAIGGGAFKEKSRAPFPWLVVAFGGVWEVQEGTLFQAGVGTNGIYMGLSGRIWT